MSLEVTYDSLRREVGRFLGFSRDFTTWNSNESIDVQDCIDAGYRRFLQPPLLPNERAAHVWSFLIPVGALTLKAGEKEMPMPPDFAGLEGDVYYDSSNQIATRIKVVNEGLVREANQNDWLDNNSYQPQYCSIVSNRRQGAEQGHTMQVWPKPDRDYRINFRYHARQDALSESNPIPLGGREHGETIRCAVMAEAENQMDDTIGVKASAFMERLQASISYDRRVNRPENLGYNGNSEGSDSVYWRSNLVTYDKYPA